MFVAKNGDVAVKLGQKCLKGRLKRIDQVQIVRGRSLGSESEMNEFTTRLGRAAKPGLRFQSIVVTG